MTIPCTFILTGMKISTFPYCYFMQHKIQCIKIAHNSSYFALLFFISVFCISETILLISCSVFLNVSCSVLSSVSAEVIWSRSSDLVFCISNLDLEVLKYPPVREPLLETWKINLYYINAARAPKISMKSKYKEIRGTIEQSIY